MVVKVSIIGTGMMGRRIAGNFAYCGHIVKLYDEDLTQLKETPAKIQEEIKKLHEDNLIESSNIKGAILISTTLSDAVSDSELIVECIIEDFDSKSVLFKKISDLAPVNSMIVTNTLTLSINDLAERVKNTGRFLGLRFLYPVYYINEVEITPSKYTSNLVIEKIRQLMTSMEKILFFRSGSIPLTLSEEKINYKRLQRIEAILNRRDLPDAPNYSDELLPELSKKQNSKFNNDFKIERESQNMNCTICVDKLRNSILIPCNHLVTCYDCSVILKSREDTCPVNIKFNIYSRGYWSLEIF